MVAHKLALIAAVAGAAFNAAAAFADSSEIVAPVLSLDAAATAPAESQPAATSPASTQPQTSERRALPMPFASPPFPGGEYQGYPLVGVVPDDTVWPLTQAIYDSHTAVGDFLKDQRITVYGWINASANLSSSRKSNMPSSYWLEANTGLLNQAVLRIERLVDSAQTDHIDWGFRSTFLYGSDYRYMTAGGWTSDQLLNRNRLYGFDATEQYFDVYFPNMAEGFILRVGRWIACPDIETQFAPDNYMGTHSLLFTVDTYTQTGIMGTLMLDKQWTLQLGIHSGTDMAPWYPGATPTGMAGIRWVSADNNDSVYLVLNAINDAKFRRFPVEGQPAGHDNFNYLVGTWQHRFTDDIHTKLEAYVMWQRDAVVGGTPSIGPVQRFGGGGGIGANIPGATMTYGAVNYTMFALTKKDFFTVRNEVMEDEDGERYGYRGLYSSHSIGLTHNFTPWLQVRPEIGYYRDWNQRAFDLGTKNGMLLAGLDVTLRF